LNIYTCIHKYDDLVAMLAPSYSENSYRASSDIDAVGLVVASCPPSAGVLLLFACAKPREHRPRKEVCHCISHMGGWCISSPVSQTRQTACARNRARTLPPCRPVLHSRLASSTLTNTLTKLEPHLTQVTFSLHIKTVKGKARMQTCPTMRGMTAFSFHNVHNRINYHTPFPFTSFLPRLLAFPLQPTVN
jgi:hypothetical protein